MEQSHWKAAGTCVYNIWYHIVWSTKYRRKALTDKVAQDCREMLHRIAFENDFLIADIEVMPDHVHIFVSAHPKYSPGGIVKNLKLLETHPELRKTFRNNKLWNPSTYYGTAGDVSRELISKYIEMQEAHVSD